VFRSKFQLNLTAQGKKHYNFDHIFGIVGINVTETGETIKSRCTADDGKDGGDLAASAVIYH